MNLLDTAVLEASYKLEHLGFEINTVKAPKLPSFQFKLVENVIKLLKQPFLVKILH